ncbi:MAG: glycoside hydrolase family 95 protein [Bacteroidaceae bacterium]|nr:glycoside hydrolase family 95 protein [Bacteroidaceae bacterium]
MKKIFFMLVSFLCMAFAAQAQTAVTDLSQLSNDKVYTLRSSRCFLLYSDAVKDKLCSSNGNSVGTVTRNNADPAQLFRIEKNGSNYYLYSLGAEKYVDASGAYVANPSAAMKIENVGGNHPWKLGLGSNYMNSQIPGQTAEGIMVNDWTTTDEGNCYIIEEGVAPSSELTVTVLGTKDAAAGVVINDTEYKNGDTFTVDYVLKRNNLKANEITGKIASAYVDGAVVYVSYFDADTKFYTIKNGKGGYVSLNPDYVNGGNLTLSNTSTPRNNQGAWAFVEQSANSGIYKVYNYSTGLAKVLGMTGSEAAARATMVAPDATSHKTEFEGSFNFDGSDASYIKIKGTSNWWNNRDNNLALWNYGSVTGDQGSKFFLEEVEIADLPNEYIYETSKIEGVKSYSPKNPNTLWYTTSAEAAGVSYPWMEYALPLGNGELGCMVFGGVLTEELQFNEKTLWSGPANTVGAGGGNRTFMNFGSLFIRNNDNAAITGVTDYVRYLDIEEGVAGVEFKNANGTKQIRKYFSSAPDQVIAGQYTIEGNDKLDLTFMLEPGTGIGASKVIYNNNTAEFTGAMTSVNYAARLHIVADQGATFKATKNGITIKNATEVVFYLKGATNFNGDMEVLNNYFTAETPADVNERVKNDIQKAVNKKFPAVRADHIADFRAITKRMTFDLGLATPTVDTKTLVDNYYPNNANADSKENDHLFLEQLYFHYGRYLAISSNRKPIAAPNNLQGIWNDRGADSPWNSDVHTNINIQMNYWPTEITNLSDLHKPFVNFIIRGAQSEGWKKVGELYNGGHGWSVLTETSLYNSMSTWGDNYLVANVWYTSHLWMHWRYTQDKEFLKKAFPVMWDCAEFWFHRLIKDRTVNDGTWVAPDEYSAEQNDHPKEDATAHAQQMISYLFENIAEAIEILGAEELKISQEQLDKLNDYLANTDKGLHTEEYTGKWGTYNGVKSGDLLLREWKYAPYSVSNDRGHRHMSHMMALFPLDQITPDNEFFEPAVNSLLLRGDEATGWSMGWKVNLWARAQDGDHAHIIIKNALKHSTTYGTDQGQGGIYYNLFDSHAPFQIDGNFGVCSGIAEMLLQSAHGYINILPALPAVWNKTGNVTGMKAMGNFTVDFCWADGKCNWVRITSNAGAELRVRCNRSAVAMNEAKILVNGNDVTVEIDENGIATIPCSKNDVVEIEFAEGTLGINSISSEAVSNGRIYDLQGRCIKEITKPGIYIVNGEKKFIK